MWTWRKECSIKIWNCTATVCFLTWSWILSTCWKIDIFYKIGCPSSSNWDPVKWISEDNEIWIGLERFRLPFNQQLSWFFYPIPTLSEHDSRSRNKSSSLRVLFSKNDHLPFLHCFQKITMSNWKACRMIPIRYSGLFHALRVMVYE